MFWRTAFLLPPLAVYGLFVVWPLLDSFYYSFTNWNGFNPDYDFVGLANFKKIFTDRLFGNAIANTAVWTVAAVTLPTLLGLGLALLLEGGMRLANFCKSVFYMPICLSAVVVGQIWVWIYQPDWGLLNTFLGAFGEPVTHAWIARPGTALPAVIVAWAWQQTGLAMVIYLAGLTTIPANLLEASRIEGATRIQQIRYIVLPLLRPATVVAVALSVINSLRGFDILYVMTGGGPFHSSDTLAMHMYNESFKKYKMGYGSSVAVILFLITLAVIWLYFRQLRKIDELAE